MHECIHKSVCARGGQRLASGFFLNHFPPFFLRQGLLSNLEFTNMANRSTNKPMGLAVSILALRGQAHTAEPSFVHRPRGIKLRCMLDCTENT